MDDNIGPEVRILGAGGNWMSICSQAAIGLNGYYSQLPQGTTVAVVTANPGEMCMKAPELVAQGAFHMAMTTPAWYVRMAIEGKGPFASKLPLSIIAEFPHDDRLVFAVRKETGITSLRQIREEQYPLRLSMPSVEMHHPAGWVVEEILRQYDLSPEKIESWGGKILRDRPRFQNLPKSVPVDPSFDALFDEAIMTRRWDRVTKENDMTFLAVDEEVLAHCEKMGMRRGFIPKGRLRGIDRDVPTIDFTGWALICREDMPERLGYLMAEALDVRQEQINQQFADDFPAMTSPFQAANVANTELPIHSGARAYFQEHGYL